MIDVFTDFLLKSSSDDGCFFLVVIVCCLVMFKIVFSACLQKWVSDNHRCIENPQAEPPAKSSATKC